MNDAKVDTDRELYREPDKTGYGDLYNDKIFVTKRGDIGINVGGLVIVKPLRHWHRLACIADDVTVTIEKRPPT